jgi:DNA-binding MarR family transcriptional regulator
MVITNCPEHATAATDVRPEDLAECVARLRGAMRRGARLADPGNRLTVAQLELLSALAEVPGIGRDELAGVLRMRPDTVTVMVGRLCGKGLIGEAAHGRHGQPARLTLTEAGRRSLQAWRATNAAVLHLAWCHLPARQRRALTAAAPALDALARAVDQLGGTPVN